MSLARGIDCCRERGLTVVIRFLDMVERYLLFVGTI